MLDNEKLENVTQAIEALGTIFFSLEEVHELYFVKTVEVGTILTRTCRDTSRFSPMLKTLQMMLLGSKK